MATPSLDHASVGIGVARFRIDEFTGQRNCVASTSCGGVRASLLLLNDRRSARRDCTLCANLSSRRGGLGWKASAALNSGFREHVKTSLLRHARYAVLIACCLSLAWLTVAVLPIALYQYFYISIPDILGSVQNVAWQTYLAPLELLGWAPTLSSVDPLVTLIPSFVLLFALWSTLFSVVILVWREWRRAV